MSAQPPVVVGVVLAAGGGRRYGMPKVKVQGWLPAAVSAVAGGGCGQVAVTLGAAKVAVPAGVEAVTVPDWRTGLSASVRAGLRYASGTPADFVVLHVIDTPDVGAAVVARVVQRAVAARSGLARAVFAGRPGHPVVIARRHWPAVMTTLRGDHGAGPFLSDAEGVAQVECGDLASGADHDTADG